MIPGGSYKKEKKGGRGGGEGGIIGRGLYGW